MNIKADGMEGARKMQGKKQALNPYLPGWEYVPDGEPRVFGDRVYLYGSHDIFGGDNFCLGDYVCWSAPVNDLGNWKLEGVIYRRNQDPRNQNGRQFMCAPDVIQGRDGRYYLYYQLSELPITSVAVSDAPVGPYSFYGYVQHPDGKPWGEKKGDVFVFDPGVLVDDDGKVYLYAGFSPKPGWFKTILKLRGNSVEESMCLQLEPDMKTVCGEEMPVVPGPVKAKGTEFEGHAFFEASSIRKVNDRYYYVYSSELSHELCYAVSRYPDREFHYGGTLISIGDIGYQGRTSPNNYMGNTHGGMAEICGKWYIFYHRQTNRQMCARQGCAEELQVQEDGSILQAEMTSCGLNRGPLEGSGTYEARIACNLKSAVGTFPYEKAHEKDKNGIHPYFTQENADNSEKPVSYIANMTDGSVAGFKYFLLNQPVWIGVKVRGTGEGIMEVRTSETGDCAVCVPVSASADWQVFSAEASLMQNGKKALFFTYRGKGYIDFREFELKEQRQENRYDKN